MAFTRLIFSDFPVLFAPGGHFPLNGSPTEQGHSSKPPGRPFHPSLLGSPLAEHPLASPPRPICGPPSPLRSSLRPQATNESLQVRVVPNMVQRNTNLARDTIDILAEDPEIPLTRTYLGSRSAFRECQLLGATVHQVPKATAAVEEVESLTDEVLGILGIDAKKGDHQ